METKILNMLHGMYLHGLTNVKEGIKMQKYKIDCTDYEGYKEREMDIIGLKSYYATEIDKSEYGDFDDWLCEMKRCGLITIIK